MVAIGEGDLAEAERIIERISRHSRRTAGFGATGTVLFARAELALARGEVNAGLQLVREAAAATSATRFPGVPQSTYAPWVVFGDSVAVVAHARYGAAEAGAPYHDSLAAKAPHVLDLDGPWLDYPVAGIVLFALGTWGVHRHSIDPADAVRLLALADRFAYNRFNPTLAWDPAFAAAESSAPGLLASVLDEYGARRGPDLHEEARALLQRLY
jgi:hypothetical protein